MTRARDALDEYVDGVRSRSEEAFSAVYALTANSLASYANGMLRDRLAAEDTVQQAFLELARAAPNLRGDGRSLRAWLYRSVRYSCLDEIRRRERRPEIVTDQVPDAGYRDEIDLPDPALQAALLALSERQRSLLVLRHVVGLSGTQVAKAIGTNRTAVYAATARAERRLRQLLEGVESEHVATSVSVEREVLDER
ncbi:MAG: sigma-70 family RNA polymerase sigma factor [Acidobacteria bacterium]|nr:sigma-70 family RNA polymerase sigma factor [Acidobacteriota bacterium]